MRAIDLSVATSIPACRLLVIPPGLNKLCLFSNAGKLEARRYGLYQQTACLEGVTLPPPEAPSFDARAPPVTSLRLSCGTEVGGTSLTNKPTS